jgi:hypothetical protein
MFHRFIGRPRIRMKFVIQDLWLGVYWKQITYPQELWLYICLLPTLPIIVTIPFRAKIWPYYANGRWYLDGDAPIIPVEEAEQPAFTAYAVSRLIPRLLYWLEWLDIYVLHCRCSWFCMTIQIQAWMVAQWKLDRENASVNS